MMKKLLSCVVATVMAFSCIGFAAYATDEVTIPTCTTHEFEGEELQITEDFMLDFGMNFTADDEFADPVVGNWLADFEIEFSENTTAILAGSYENYENGNWVIGNFENEDLGLTENGFSFKAGEPIKIMQYFFGKIAGANNKNVNFTYNDIINFVKSFDCGLKVTSDNDTQITLALKLYEAEKSEEVNEDGHYEYTTNGVEHVVYEKVFTYTSLSSLLAETADDEKKAEIINENVDSYNSATAAEAIKNLSEEGKEAISVKTMEFLAEESVLEEGVLEEEGVEVTKIEGTNDTLTVTVTAEEAENADHVALSNGDIYDINAFINGAEVKDEILEAPVLVKIPVADSSAVKEILHCHEGDVESIPFEQGDGYVAFTMVKFSQVSIVYDAEPAVGGAVLEFVPVNVDEDNGIATFDLVLRGENADVVKYFTAGEFAVAASDAVARYDIAVAHPEETSIKYETLADGSRKYHIELKAWDKVNSWTANITDASLVLGTLTVEGFGVEGAVAFVDGSIIMNKHDASQNAENLTVEIPTETGNSAVYDIPVPTRELTINVIANHNVTNQNWNYQDMTVTISGVDLTDDIIFNLGTESTDVEFANNTYTVAAELLLNKDYTIKVEGAGYRTAEYNVTMNYDKAVTFWNNAKDGEEAMEVYTDADSQVVKSGNSAVNFLAGDIVKDNQINIYDLSAVVSYFDEEVTDFTQKSNLAQYDLNRDGKINSKDIAILLESWNK